MRYYKTTIEHTPTQPLVCHTYVDTDKCPPGYSENQTQANRQAIKQLDKYADKCREQSSRLNLQDMTISIAPAYTTTTTDKIKLEPITPLNMSTYTPFTSPYPFDHITSPIGSIQPVTIPTYPSDMSYNP